MLRFCLRTFFNHEFKQTYKSYKHNKFKDAIICSYSSLLVQTNLTFSHVSNLFLYINNQFHTNQYLKARVFKDEENVYAYNILQTIPVTDRQLFTIKTPSKSISSLDDFDSMLNQNWRSKSAAEIAEAFRSALSYCKENGITVSDTRFDKLVDGLMDHVQDLTDAELSDLLMCFSEYPMCESYTAHNFHDIWSALDDMCCSRVHNWPKETLFLFAEHWYRLHLGKFSDYLFYFIERIRKRSDFISKDELVHLFFYLKVNKRHKVEFEYQHALDSRIASMSLPEITVAAMTFARFETKIKLEMTATSMINKLKQELPNADEICVRKIVEVLRYSSHVLLVDQLMDLLDHLVPEIDRFSCLCCMHIALLGTTLQFFHEKSLEKISQKILSNLSDTSQVRLKDMERLLLALTMFDFNPSTVPDIFDSICKELQREERRKELVQYSRSLPCSLNFLSFRQIYCHDLMNQLLNKDRYVEIYGKSAKTFSRDLFSLDVGIEVECPDYKGNRLDTAFRRKVAKWLVEYTPSWNQHKKISAADRFHLDVIETVAKIVRGHSNLHTEHVLPNYVKSDIIVCKNQSGNFVPPLGFDGYTLGDVMRPPDANLKWFAVMPVNWNNVIRNTTKPLGLISMKCRQLKTIGYEPIMVFSSEYRDLSEQDKIKYVLNKINLQQ